MTKLGEAALGWSGREAPEAPGPRGPQAPGRWGPAPRTPLCVAFVCLHSELAVLIGRLLSVGPQIMTCRSGFMTVEASRFSPTAAAPVRESGP